MPVDLALRLLGQPFPSLYKCTQLIQQHTWRSAAVSRTKKKKKKETNDHTTLTIQLGTRPLTGDVLLPSPLVDALFCKIEAHAGHGDQADPAKHLERDRYV